MVPGGNLIINKLMCIQNKQYEQSDKLDKP